MRDVRKITVGELKDKIDRVRDVRKITVGELKDKIDKVVEKEGRDLPILLNYEEQITFCKFIPIFLTKMWTGGYAVDPEFVEKCLYFPLNKYDLERFKDEL